MRTILEIQERALATLVRIGEAEKKTVHYEKQDTHGNTVMGTKQIYKVKEDSRYGLRSQPREEVPFHKCCLTCRHKCVVGGERASDEPQRVCEITEQPVTKFQVCNEHSFRDYLKRI